jgi:putative inorganic carbon (hco3(-)) transporter
VNFTEKKAKYIFLASVLLYIIINAVLMAHEFFWLNVLPIAIFFAFLGFFSLDIYLFVIVALVPLSVPMSYFIHGLSVDLFLPTEPLIAGAMLLFILKFLKEGTFDKKIIFHPVTIAILLNITWIIITTLTSSMPVVSIKFLIARCWFVIAFYFIASQLFSNYKNYYKYIWCYTLAVIPVIGFFIYRLSHEGLTNQKAANWVVYPFYNDHTAYGAALAMILPLLIGIFFIKRKANNSSKFFYGLMITIYIAALILSYTRAAWLSLFIASIFFLAMLFKVQLKMVFIGLVLLIGVFFAYQTEIFMSLEKNKQDSSGTFTKHLKSMTNIRTDASNLERLNRWNSAFKMFHEHPIVGFGPGTYAFQYAPYQLSKDKTIISTNAGNGGNAHSEYIGPLAESGILGFATFLAIVLTTLYTAWKVYYNSKRRKIRLLALCLFLSLLTYYLHGCMNDFLDTDKLSALFWGFTAMVVTLDVYYLKEEKTAAKVQ